MSSSEVSIGACDNCGGEADANPSIRCPDCSDCGHAERLAELETENARLKSSTEASERSRLYWRSETSRVLRSAIAERDTLTRERDEARAACAASNAALKTLLTDCGSHGFHTNLCASTTGPNDACEAGCAAVHSALSSTTGVP